MGGGKALVNAYYRSAEALGVQVRYDAPVDRARNRRRPLRRGARRRGAHRGARLRRRLRRLRIEPRVAARSVGPQRSRRMAGRQLPDPRHPLQHGRGAARPDRRAARTPSATRRRATAWRSTRARRCTTAASARASTACRSASWSTATRSASTTKARTSGPSATRSGAGWSRMQPGQIGYSIIDAKAIGRFMPPVFPGEKAPHAARSSRASSASPEAAFVATVQDVQRGVPRRHASTTRCSTTATPRD